MKPQMEKQSENNSKQWSVAFIPLEGFRRRPTAQMREEQKSEWVKEESSECGCHSRTKLQLKSREFVWGLCVSVSFQDQR